MMRNNEKEAPGEKRFKLPDYFKITVMGFAFTAIWSSLQGVILPIRLLEWIDESQKNTYLGMLTFTGLVLAMVVQPFIGVLSDRTVSRWGKRRPYIFIGTILALAFLPGIGWVDSFTAILVMYCLLQVSCNTAQASYQALIPDFLPQNKRGLASGLKSLLELLGGFALVRLTAYLMGHYYEGEEQTWLWLALVSLTFVMLGISVATIVSVKEQPSFKTNRPPQPVLQSLKIDFKVHRHFLWFLVSRGLLGMPGVILQTFILYYLMDVVGLANPAAVAGDLLVVVGVCLVGASFPAGRLSDRFGRQPVLIISSAIGIAGTLILFFTRSYSHLMISGALLGISNGGLLSSSWALATDFVAKGEEAKYLAVTNFAMVVGSALARLVGPAIDYFNGLSPGSGYRFMLGVCLFSFVIGGLLVFKTRPKKAQKPAPTGI